MKIIALYLVILLASCNANKETGSSASEKINSDTIVASDSSLTGTITPGCYEMIIEKDSALMNISLNGNKVSGKLQYKRFEKDRNTGNFIGNIDSGKIIGWYTFQSEGMVSVRQVIFKVMQDKISEGYGDIELKGDTAYFKYPHTLNFEENHPFIKVNCK